MTRLTRLAILLVAVVAAFAADAAAQSSFTLASPNKRISVAVRTTDRVRYDVSFDGKPLMRDATLSLDVDHTTLGANPKVRASKPSSVDRAIEPPVRQIAKTLPERYNELRLEMEGDYAVVFRAYDEGVAYRIETSLAKANVKVYGEEATFQFVGDHQINYPQEETFFSHNERSYAARALSSIPATAIATLPAVVDVDGVKVAIAESGVEEYPGLWLKGTGGPALTATFPPYPLEEALAETAGVKSDRDFRVTKAADYIADTTGKRVYPWRLFGIAAHDADLLANPLVYLLAEPSRVKDTSWIKPGKVAWDWWNALNVYGVDFKSGVNTETYKYFIDFAAAHGLQYIVLDEGWYKLGNVLDVQPEVDVPAIVAYGKQKHVGVILWVIWKTLDDQMTPALDQYERWGVAGVKVDFMQRDDQKLMQFNYRLCAEAAKRKMLVDLHGAQRSVLLTRTWPNLISNEGVKGMEWCKWSADTDPEHAVTVPFTRMFLGPMDFTPGAMLNATKRDFSFVFDRPMSQGTRCQQLAMYAVYMSPLQMLADSPSNYLKEPESLAFLSAVPTTWDETRPLDGKIGDYVVVTRRSGDDWYVGAMTDWTGRDVTVDLEFLPAGSYEMTAFADGKNADRFASDYSRSTTSVDRTTKLKVTLASGGGWVAHLRPAAKK